MTYKIRKQSEKYFNIRRRLKNILKYASIEWF